MHCDLYHNSYIRGVHPPERITPAEWADKYLMVPLGSAEPGKFSLSRTPYMRGVLDALADDSPYRKVVCQWVPQSGKSQIALAWLGYTIHIDPSPFMWVMDTVENIEKMSKRRVQPMLDETEVLQGLVKPQVEKQSGNTILMKEYPGGQFIGAGSNSTSGIRSQYVRRLVLDEVSAWKADLLQQGNPVDIAIERTKTFGAKAKILITSSVTIEGDLIDQEYSQGTQAYYHVPCPDCGHMQSLVWANLFFDSSTYHQTGVQYRCSECGVLISESKRQYMLEHGEWVHTHPERQVASFALNALYTPPGWVSWVDLVDQHQVAHRTRDREKWKTFTNFICNEPWREHGETLEENDLASRVEEYPAAVPDGVDALCCSIDVQADRLECMVVGYKAYQETNEMYVIEHTILGGDTLQPHVWQDLSIYIDRTYADVQGNTYPIIAVAIDYGFRGEMVARWVKQHQHRRVYAVMGNGQIGAPAISKPSNKSQHGILFYPLGTSRWKDSIYSRLRQSDHGPGAIHFPTGLGDEFFKQLTAEEAVTKYKSGIPYIEYKQRYHRNEALDLMVYNMAVCSLLFPGWSNWQQIRQDNVNRFTLQQQQPVLEQQPIQQQPVQEQQQQQRVQVIKPIGRTPHGRY